ncbi:MAG: AMP-binding protein [Rhodospirillaceae bacterium]
MNIGDLPQIAAKRSPGAIAFVEDDKQWTWDQWSEEIAMFAGGLQELGIARGDHCICVMPNSHAMATVYFACQLIGAIFTPFNWRSSKEDFLFVYQDTGAEIVILDEGASPSARDAAHAACLRNIVTMSGGVGEIVFENLFAFEPLQTQHDPNSSDICLMLYTSGTTGAPKGVPRSISSELAASMACIAQLQLQQGDNVLGVMPLFHTMGIRVLLMAALLGGGWINMRRFDPLGALKLIESEAIKTLFLVPTMYHDIMKCADFSGTKTTSVRVMAYAGMSMTRHLEQTILEKFRPKVFANYYGSSEIFTLAVCTDLAKKPGSAGWAGIGQTLRIVPADRQIGVKGEIDLPWGEIGEVVASMKSPEAFKGYWRRPDADLKSIKDDWYYTGDLGYFDKDGALFLCGRVDDMIISGGENIHPEEVEDTLSSCEDVGLVAVVGVDDNRWGQKVVAFVEPTSETITARNLDLFLKQSSLARFKHPKSYVFVHKIPKSSSGKLLRRALRKGDYKVLSGYDTAL